MKKKQGGFVLLSISIALGFIVVAGIIVVNMAQEKAIKENMNSFYNHIVYLTQQVQAYSNYRVIQKGTPPDSIAVFPSNLGQLEGEFIPVCRSSDERKGLCRRYDQTPWGRIDPSWYRRVPVGNIGNPDFYYAELALELPDKTNVSFKKELAITLRLFSRLPNIKYDETANKITIRIDRPDKAIAYEGLVKRTGDDSTLTGDWDVGGNFAITNAKDISLTASDGTQFIVSNKLSLGFDVKHGEWINKPKCIAGQTSRIRYGIGAIKVPVSTHEIKGGTNTYIMSNSTTRWQLGISIQTKRLSDGQSEILHSGRITGSTSCR
ncbi:type II secretion system protein [Vibrio tapetis subsp. quintayensis]|uniref:type II secretion system protein n=1 Tax=Vibrio tapetis TaxID=52443 RepID=UPI0025B5707E|nr:type II secretion system protein [Vibrio tapetis]MDN3683203.1 type II secretion system protein [Vibrio tapetis subsp. quintayensis]